MRFTTRYLYDIVDRVDFTMKVVNPDLAAVDSGRQWGQPLAHIDLLTIGKS